MRAIFQQHEAYRDLEERYRVHRREAEHGVKRELVVGALVILLVGIACTLEIGEPPPASDDTAENPEASIEATAAAASGDSALPTAALDTVPPDSEATGAVGGDAPRGTELSGSFELTGRVLLWATGCEAERDAGGREFNGSESYYSGFTTLLQEFTVMTSTAWDLTGTCGSDFFGAVPALASAYDFISAPGRTGEGTVVLRTGDGSELVGRLLPASAFTFTAIDEDTRLLETSYHAEIIGGTGRFFGAQGTISVQRNSRSDWNVETGEYQFVEFTINQVTLDIQLPVAP